MQHLALEASGLLVPLLDLAGGAGDGLGLGLLAGHKGGFEGDLHVHQGAVLPHHRLAVLVASPNLG